MTGFITTILSMKVIYADHLEDLLYIDFDEGWKLPKRAKYPINVVKKFQSQCALLEELENSTKMYKYPTLRPHQLHWNLDWFLGIDLTKWRRIEIKILEEWVLEIVKVYRIGNHYER